MAKLLVTLQVQFVIEGEDETDDVAVEELVAEMEREMPAVAVGGTVEVQSVDLMEETVQ
jgi:hypothetical protein